MSFSRAMILTVGPFAIVAACYWLTMAHPRENAVAAHFVLSPSVDGAVTGSRNDGVPLPLACERRASELAALLTAECHLIVRPPYVLAGDMTPEELERHYRQTILTTAAILRNSYFDTIPNRPVTILLFSGNESYREFSREYDGHRQDAYSGYYQKSDDRLVVNAVTGNGTLAHELTHALAQFDFPDMPEWFDEGLASLHEQCEISDDGRRLLGVSNWRRYHLLYALQTGRLRSLESLISTAEIREDHEAVDYGHARYFCLFLQSKGLLSAFYRSFRDSISADPTGINTLLRLLQIDSLSAVDSEFRSWFLTQCQSRHGASSPMQETGPAAFEAATAAQ